MADQIEIADNYGGGENNFDNTFGDNKAIPRLRMNELNENSTRYDQMAAAPPDETLVYYWYTWAVITVSVGLFSFLLFASILTNKKVRRKPFNLYLLYLLVPDFTFSLLCGITCFMNAFKGSYYSKAMCNMQQWYTVFGIGGSAWINAIIAYQVHAMLKDSNVRRRYRVPTSNAVSLQCLAAFAWVIFLGSWGVYEEARFPFHSGLISGLACLPTEVDEESSYYFWLLFVPLFVGIPTFYGLHVSFDIQRRKLLPPTGKRRLLSIYFGRLLLVFCIFWIPSVILIFVLPSFTPSWSGFAGGTWSHLQTLMSAVVISRKPDIYKAFMDFLCCRPFVAKVRGRELGSESQKEDARASTVRWEKSFVLRSGVSSRRSYTDDSQSVGVGGTAPADGPLTGGDSSSILDISGNLMERKNLSSEAEGALEATTELSNDLKKSIESNDQLEISDESDDEVKDDGIEDAMV
ncbi:unnamed protein product [Cylindrotheca closterium]|uniref:G-protein coupled receptors family 1 profile domain-containing protein n=1 Tax=Cylindrotheca closterium TaxID=2856 RepID=A0AAD2CKS5_9STRA|nr:unnamed protein product [Cylindrotheca closterium]